jgi:acetyl esterase/lipase
VPILDLVPQGYAVASVDYRLSTVAPFPAQVHDLKAAIRYLRGTAARHGIAAERIAIAGSSAGGHLALLVGVTAGVPELEGDVGAYREQSSAVQAVVDFFGPTNLTTILAQSTPHGLSVRIPALKLLLGGLPEERAALAQLASPVLHLDPRDPPLLVYHGDQDPQVPIQQSQELVEACRKAGVEVRFEVVEGGAHGGERFFTPSQIAQVKAFLDRLLRPGFAP